MFLAKSYRLVSPFCLVFLAFAVGCGGSGPSNPNPVDSLITSQKAAVSDCGGFSKQGRPFLATPAAYCDAEVLQWEYAAATSTLELADNRAGLNCCGDHDIKVEEKEGVYVFTETDRPPENSARCRCTCVFDFGITVEGVAEGVVPVRLERVISDFPEGSGLIYEGELDLGQGSGSVVLDTAPAVFCQEQ